MLEWKRPTTRAALLSALLCLSGCRIEDFTGGHLTLPTIGATPTPAVTPAPSPVATTPPPLAPAGDLDAQLSFYGWGDDSNSTHIAYPRSASPGARHEQAGGTGTWRDPITFAADATEFPVGTLIWVPSVRKYFVMEDDCQACGNAWRNDGHRKVELWTGTANAGNVAAEEDCETLLTPQDGSGRIVVAPPPNEPVSKEPLFNVSTGKCFKKAEARVAAATPTPIVDEGMHPSWLGDAIIYDIYPEIFSPGGNLAGVTAQLPRLHALGVNVLWLMPVFPVGHPYHDHPANDNPYAISDYEKIDPRYGTPADLSNLVKSAHGLGMKVILDVALNQTSWDSPLLAKHPEFYVHSDDKLHDPRSIKQAFDSTDVAQFDYKSENGLGDYMTAMLKGLLKKYDVDGFRFDLADNPPGDERMIPASFWQALRPQLESVKPDILMLGAEENQTLMTQPFELDYGWQLQRGLVSAVTTDAADKLADVWQVQHNNWPDRTMHMSFLEDWDTGNDLKLYWGADAVKALAVFDFTIDGVPMLWNGEEAGNTIGDVDTHKPIDWNGEKAQEFTEFYKSLIALRNSSSALRQGTFKWIHNDVVGGAITYDRSDASGEYIVEINPTRNMIGGSMKDIPNDSLPYPWIDVTPTGAPGGKNHVAPPNLKLPPHDFAIFRRGS